MSLRRMVLRDFVIVSELELEFGPGFTVLTGETGAGKSILIGALQLATGERADVNLIREGAQRTEVSAEFDTTPALEAWLLEAGFDLDGSILLRRSISIEGKSRGWINGSPASVAQLRALGQRLLDIHGQHAWQSLTRSQSARELLDAYAKVSTKALADLWRRWRAAQEQLARWRALQDVRQDESERLRWQIDELEKLAPAAGEWPALNAEQARLAHAQDLLQAAQSALLALSDHDRSACALSAAAAVELQKQQHIEPAFKELAEVLASAGAQLSDVAHSLRAYLRKTDSNPDRLQALDQRLRLWLSLARRYKCQPEQLTDFWLDCQHRLQQLDAAADLGLQEQAVAQAWQAYEMEAKKITAARQLAAPLLAQTISAAMQTLGMAGGRFEVQLEPAKEPLPSGLQEVGFLVAGHAGSTPKAVAKVASGGELSRLALAVALATSAPDGAQTLIFDEVDAGVGGAVAVTVGQLLRRLGAEHQVLAVTHLPQVAACANWHLVVSKQLSAGSSLSSVTPVAGQERVAELARMLGAEDVLQSGISHAQEMLQAARSLA